MSKLDLSIEFANPQRTYAPGEVVAGEVIVSANKDVDCRELVLSHRWETHGKGNKHKDMETTHWLYRGPWTAGDVYRYPFQFTAPDGPPTYHGHHLNIDHYVRARADIPWSIDPKTQEEFVLVPAAVPPDALADAAANEDNFVEEDFQGHGAPGEWIGILVACAVCGAVMYFVDSIVFRVVCGIVLLIVVGGFARRIMTRGLFREVVLRAQPQHARPGDSVAVRISAAPLKSLSVERITATLRGQEVCVSGSGTNETTHKHVLHQEELKLCRDVRLMPEEEFEYQAQFVIPHTDAYSFVAKDNKLTWSVDFQVHVPRWPDWKGELELFVTPDPQGDLERLARDLEV